jgi:hypothetical protein
MHSSDDLALVEEFFFFIDVPEGSELEPIQLSARVNLAEFAFTEDELKKLRKLAQKLELALLSEFTKKWAVASVVVEIRE